MIPFSEDSFLMFYYVLLCFTGFINFQGGIPIVGGTRQMGQGKVRVLVQVQVTAGNHLKLGWLSYFEDF